MKLLYPNASKFKNLTQVLAKVVDEAPIYLTETGLVSKSLSEDKTTMVVINVPAESFEAIELEENVSFKVNTREFHRIARRGTRNDMLELQVDKENRVLKIVFRDKKNDVIRAFEVPITFEDIEEVGEPKVKLPVKMDMIAGDFKELITDAKIVGEEVIFRYTGESIKVYSESAGREYESELKAGEPLLSLSSEVEEAEAKYSIELLAASTRAASASATVSIGFGPALPMKLYFEIPDVGSLAYWIAPRV